MSDEQQGRDRGRLRRVGSMWAPRAGARSLGSGSVTINGLRQRFVVLKNDKRQEGSRQPDYLLMSGDEPEVDQYAHDRHTARRLAESATSEPDPPF